MVERTLEVSEASPGERAMLADLIGSKDDDTLSIMVALSSADGSVTEAVAKINELADMDSMTCGVHAASLDRGDIKGVWAALEAVGAVVSAMPSVDVKAALSVAQSVQDLSDEHRRSLNRVADLADF